MGGANRAPENWGGGQKLNGLGPLNTILPSSPLPFSLPPSLPPCPTLPSRDWAMCPRPFEPHGVGLGSGLESGQIRFRVRPGGTIAPVSHAVY